MAARARSNVDHTRLISKSIFVTNFPDNTTSKDLWEVCKGYGTVVDVFIPDRKSKAGKRFAFVRFIKVDNVDRLVGNLCTLWIGRMHLHANVARFDRPPIHSSRPNISTRPAANGASSFASVLKGNPNKNYSEDDSVNAAEEINGDISKQMNLEHDETDIEVRCMEDRLGSVYNAQGANEFNSFISNSGLVEIQLEGKEEIRSWVNDCKKNQSGRLVDLRSKLCHIDKVIDQGGVNDDILLTRLDLLKKIHDIKSSDARDYMQKAKIQWAIEGDENSIFFHGIINRKRANLAIKGVMVDGEWVDDPCRLDMLESPISRDEVRNVVWGCGENKSPGPDGFTFEFFRKFWDI
ncbi:RNA-directed DNA polymerase, eukaryota [Tanacetum coccineum]